MNKKSLIIGIVIAIALTGILVMIYGIKKNQEPDPIQYLKQPVSYEDKSVACFKVFDRPFSDAALVSEESEFGYFGNTVLLLGEDFYNNQVITVNNPQRVGTFTYDTRGGLTMTVPVVKGDIGADGRGVPTAQNEAPFRLLEHPENYEGKKTASFEVSKVVLDGYAIAREESHRYSDGSSSYFGKTVLLKGSDFYKGMVVTVKNPQRIGSFRYEGDIVPVIETERK